jgi:transmembrane sensor
MNAQELSRLIKRLKEGTATAKERELLESRWEKALGDDAGLKDFSPSDREELKAEMFQSISERLRFDQRERRNPVILWYKVAASIAVLFVLTLFLYSHYSAVESPAIAENQFIDVQTKFGEQLSVKLPDQSSVVLNGNSTLRYSKNWSSAHSREVWITGEGFFAVQHTKNHQKFIVHTQEGLNVEVLGTKFNVKSRGRGSEVLLTEGSVKLNLSSESKEAVILQPGEMATMKEKKLLKKSVEGKKYTSWVSRKLYFDKMPLTELAEMLNDTYGVKVTFQNEDLKTRQLSGEISSASIDDILYAIAETFDVEVTKQDENSLIFSSKLK